MKPTFSARLVRLALDALVLAALGAPVLAGPPGLRETARYKIEGSGETGALALDAGAGRLYAARGSRIDALDAGSGAKTGSLSLPAGVRGLAIAPDLDRGYASLDNDAIAIFSLRSLSLLTTPASPGKGAASIAYDPDTGRVFVADRAGGDLAVLDARTGAVAADLPLGGELTGVACDGFARLFVTAADRNVVHVLDAHALKSLGDYPTAPGAGPAGLAIEDEGRRLFVPCLNGKLVVLDDDIGAVFRVLPLAGKGAASVAFGLADPDAPVGDIPWKGRIVTVTQDGTLNVGRMLAFVNYAAYDHRALGARPLGVAIDGPRQRAYVLLAVSPSDSEVLVLAPCACPSSP